MEKEEVKKQVRTILTAKVRPDDPIRAPRRFPYAALLAIFPLSLVSALAFYSPMTSKVVQSVHWGKYLVFVGGGLIGLLTVIMLFRLTVALWRWFTTQGTITESDNKRAQKKLIEAAHKKLSPEFRAIFTNLVDEIYQLKETPYQSFLQNKVDLCADVCGEVFYAGALDQKISKQIGDNPTKVRAGTLAFNLQHEHEKITGRASTVTQELSRLRSSLEHLEKKVHTGEEKRQLDYQAGILKSHLEKLSVELRQAEAELRFIA